MRDCCGSSPKTVSLNEPRKLNAEKIRRKIGKCLRQLQKHDPDVRHSLQPTQILFVGNSSALCGVSFDELEKVFIEYDESCQFVVYPNKRPYSFVHFSSIDNAQRAFAALNGKVPDGVGPNALPFFIAYVENLPCAKKDEQVRPPADLRVLMNFVDENEEQELMASLKDCVYAKTKLKSRKVVHFGYKFNYDTNEADVPAENAIPQSCSGIIDRMMRAGIFTERPDQLTVNIYEPGNGIPSHVDSHSPFGDTIVSLSLMSDLVMEFRDFANTSSVYNVLLPRYSLAVMQGESRYRWKHGIAKRKYDINPDNNRLIRRQLRVSFTFRKVASQKCQCSFIEYCDWDRNGTMKIPEDDEHGKRIEDDYVTSVYESIADHFDKTRHSQWVAVAEFLKELPPSSLLFDVGCGNGKYLARKDQLIKVESIADHFDKTRHSQWVAVAEFLKELPPSSLLFDVGCGNGKYLARKDQLIKIGCDMCDNLCRIAQGKGGNVVRSDALNLSFRDSIADAALSIAVIHHLSTEKRRRRAIEELMRILRIGGCACVTVWAMEQTHDNVVSEYLKMRGNKCHVQMNRRDSRGRLRVHEGQDFTQQDMLVPWQNANGERFLRYYHLFVAGELEELCSGVPNCEVMKSLYEEGNWIVILKKIAQ
ncbi:Alkylated DNA repair protein alkB -like protein 8 [Toxocara canis]|uniref:tRNA (carboxymethyluridine(34)-5-O)-methyltransferase n=1 Tax=Toxocara canis TaxID=6265 RepID=A0A0B2US68_TOXCA|nr:Alkylated DNA repair protein alkB -like protein 8 [Toxocara canis]